MNTDDISTLNAYIFYSQERILIGYQNVLEGLVLMF